jgi:hypothetical protein
MRYRVMIPSYEGTEHRSDGWYRRVKLVTWKMTDDFQEALDAVNSMGFSSHKASIVDTVAEPHRYDYLVEKVEYEPYLIW